MRQISFFTIVFLFFSFSSSFCQVQAWCKNGVFSPGAFKAYYEVWGKQMGFTPQETMEEVVRMYNSGKFINKLVWNSGVTPEGKVVFFKKEATHQVIYLGSSDATLVDKNKTGWTVEFYLKRDCLNLCCIFIPPAEPEPEEEKVKAPEKGSWKPYNPQKEKQVFVPVEQNYIIIKQMKKNCWMKKSYGHPQGVECHGGGTQTGVVKTILEADKYQFLDQTEIISRGSGRWTEVFWEIQ